MEGQKIVRFPNAATPAERASARLRQEGIESGKVAELYPSLDLAKVVGIRRIVEEERASEIAPYRFGEEKFAEARLEVDALALAKAIGEVNDSTEDMVRLDPVRYIALLDFIEKHTPSSQEDE